MLGCFRAIVWYFYILFFFGEGGERWVRDALTPNANVDARMISAMWQTMLADDTFQKTEDRHHNEIVWVPVALKYDAWLKADELLLSFLAITYYSSLITR